MSVHGVPFITAFERANIHGRLTLIEGVDIKDPRNFIASMTFCGALVDVLNLVHYLGQVRVQGIVESVKDGATIVSVADIDRDLITDKKH